MPPLCDAQCNNKQLTILPNGGNITLTSNQEALPKYIIFMYEGGPNCTRSVQFGRGLYINIMYLCGSLLFVDLIWTLANIYAYRLHIACDA